MTLFERIPRINSLPPGEAAKILVNIGSGSGLLPDSTKQ